MKLSLLLIRVGILGSVWENLVLGSDDQARLIRDLFRNYNPLLRPIRNIGDTVNVTFAMTLGLLIYVAESLIPWDWITDQHELSRFLKNLSCGPQEQGSLNKQDGRFNYSYFQNERQQVMKTNGYTNLEWNDPQFVWDIGDYGGIAAIRVPVDKVWTPDIVLITNTDGKFGPSYKSNAVIYNGGSVNWLPPFIYRSSCLIQVENFPFDRLFLEDLHIADEYGQQLVSENTSFSLPEESNDFMNLGDDKLFCGTFFGFHRSCLDPAERKEYSYPWAGWSTRSDRNCTAKNKNTGHVTLHSVNTADLSEDGRSESSDLHSGFCGPLRVEAGLIGAFGRVSTVTWLRLGRGKRSRRKWKNFLKSLPEALFLQQQECSMRFASWTYNAREVNIIPRNSVVDVSNYLRGGIWDLVDARVKRVSYEHYGYAVRETVPRVDIIVTIVIRRKPLFYTINLLIPTVLISFMTVFVFLLPTVAGEKITLTISLTLTIVVFLLLVSKILPPAEAMPLISKFLLFIFIMNLISVFVTVITINLNYRGPKTHDMPSLLRLIFLQIFPPLLLMRRPPAHFLRRRPKSFRANRNAPYTAGNKLHKPPSSPVAFRRSPTSREYVPLQNHAPLLQQLSVPGLRFMDDTDSLSGEERYELYHSEDAELVGESVDRIAAHLEKDNEIKQIEEDWRYLALVVDRILLWIFFWGTCIGSITILLRSDNIFVHVDEDATTARLKSMLSTG